jgi:hypothetical protein
MRINTTKIIAGFLIVTVPAFAVAQSKRRTTAKKPEIKPVTTETAAPASSRTPGASATLEPGKKNGRPADQKLLSRDAGIRTFQPVYSYAFDRPGFIYSSIKIEHDEDGKGAVKIKRDGYDEVFDEPIELSSATMDRLRAAFSNLNFLDSLEDYQYPARDYSNMGNVAITVTRSGRSRTAKYNWTDNKNAKALMDIYRAISNEAIWKFEMASAQENQPLLTPGLVDGLEGYIRRSEIADPPHMIPYLTQLSRDERLPLIARNHLSRIIAQIQKH